MNKLIIITAYFLFSTGYCYTKTIHREEYEQHKQACMGVEEYELNNQPALMTAGIYKLCIFTEDEMLTKRIVVIRD